MYTICNYYRYVIKDVKYCMKYYIRLKCYYWCDEIIYMLKLIYNEVKTVITINPVTTI